MARDADAPRPDTLVTTSETVELLFAVNLVASSSPPREALEAGWVERQRAQLPEGARAALSRLAGFWWPTLGLCDFLCYNGHFDDPEAFLKDVASLPIDRFVEILYNSDLTSSQVRELFANPQGVHAFEASFCQFSGGTAEAHEGLFADPEGHRQALLTAVRGSRTPLFEQSWNDWKREGLPSVRQVQSALIGEDPLVVAERIRQKPIHGPRQFNRYVFVPSRFIGHPHIRSWGDGVYIFFMQEGAIHLPATGQTGAELAEFLKVLGDPTRMDILRLLSGRASYGKEIASALGLTTATVSRHLDQLKAAGLVREDRADSNNVKALRYVSEALDAQLDRLKTYLLH